MLHCQFNAYLIFILIFFRYANANASYNARNTLLHSSHAIKYLTVLYLSRIFYKKIRH